MRMGAVRFGWSRRNPRAAIDAGRALFWLAWGMATSTYPTHRMPADARVRLGADGVSAGAGWDLKMLGTGTYTVMAQRPPRMGLGFWLAASRRTGRQQIFPRAPVSGGSMTVASVGPAVLSAAYGAAGETVRYGASRRIRWRGCPGRCTAIERWRGDRP